MDEDKEVSAALKRIDGGISNEAIECAAMTGLPRDLIYAQRVREINQRKADDTWAQRPTETVRVSPPTDPNQNATPVSDPAQADNPEDA
jgi:capsid protein